MVVPLSDVVIARVVESEVGRELQLGFVRGPAETAKPVPSRADDGLDRSRGDFRRPAPSALDARRCSPSSPPHPPTTVPAIAATAIQAFTGTDDSPPSAAHDHPAAAPMRGAV
jgi:hypothetical protein